MSFIWRKYYLIAENWFKSDNTEEANRSIISRSYYAAFCTSRNYLQVSVKTGDVHELVKNRFKDSDDLDVILAGTTLESLRIERNRADYDASAHITKNSATKALEKAKIVLDIIDELEK